MKLRHKTPCKECPWRKTAPPGFLGGNTPETYADIVQCNGVPNCHLNQGAFCVGGLAVANNSCTAVRMSPEASAAADVIGTREDYFKWVGDFYRHHAGKEYVNPITRFFLTRKNA